LAKDGNLGCSVCSRVKSLGPDEVSAGIRLKLANEWTTTAIQPYGNTRDKMLTSLRKKIHSHSDSDSHKSALKVMSKANSDTLKKTIVEQQRSHVSCTTKVFRTIYYIAKHNRPYLDHTHLVQLQELNGIDMGRMLHSNVVAADICEHISQQMRRKLISAIIAAGLPISVLIDESTSLSHKSCLIVYIRCSVDDSVGPVTVFLDLLELSSLSAESIVDSLLSCLNSHGLTQSFLQDHWLGLATDGASVMLGRKAGVFVTLKAKYNQLIGWHCLNHRLELSVHDAVKLCTEVNPFKIFMDKLYTLYSVSPKNRRYLEECAADVGGELLKIGKVLDVRWVASSYRAVKAVWVSYSSLYGHFTSASEDVRLDSKERAQFNGLAKKLASVQFLLNLALMLDALEELKDLSEALQADDITVYRAVRMIGRQIEVFEYRKSQGGTAYSAAENAIAESSFHGVGLVHTSRGGGTVAINRAQFYQALADSMQSRLLPEAEQPIVQAIQTVLPGTWAASLPPEYGEPQLKELCSKFGVPYSSALKQQYREYKQSKGCDMGGAVMKRFVFAVDTLPVSTAACERGFSRMNVICSALRTRLSIAHLSSLMFVGMEGPPMSSFNPTAYVKSWLAAGRHAATDMGKTKKEKEVRAGPGQVAIWKVM